MKSLLEVVLGRVAGVVDQIVVVKAESQTLPTLDSARLNCNVTIATDEFPERGPLQGMSAGFKALPSTCETVFLTSCDVPFLNPELIDYLFKQLSSHDIVLPTDGKFSHVLTAVYRTCVASTIDRLISEDRWRPLFVTDFHPTNKIEMDQIREVDPNFDSFNNLNTPQLYLEALERAGFNELALQQKKLLNI